MAQNKYDSTFLEILSNEGKILNFLDSVFGFLYRCTDFYHIQKHSGECLGFPKGVIEKLVANSLQKWQYLALQDERRRLGSDDANIPEAIVEEVVSTGDSDLPERPRNKIVPRRKREENPQTKKPPDKLDENKSIDDGRIVNKGQFCSDSYNGAVCDTYCWSQTIQDLDVKVSIPTHVIKAKDVQVDITATSLTVSVQREDAWEVLVTGELSRKTVKAESVWSLVPGEHIHIHFEKQKEEWWDALYAAGEPKINLRGIDASRPMDELPEAEQMKLQELVWNHEQMRMNRPTSDQLKVDKILQQAWDKDGSPFKGQPFDPTLVTYAAGKVPNPKPS